MDLIELGAYCKMDQCPTRILHYRRRMYNDDTLC